MLTLEAEISSLLNIFRYIFADNTKLIKSIQPEYEEALLDDLKLVPKEIKDYILNYVNVVKLVLHHFDLVGFNNSLKTISEDDFPIFTFNSYDLFIQIMGKLNLTNKDKARIRNLTTKFKPLFSCLDLVVNKVRFAIDKLAQYETAGSEVDSLLD